MAFFAPETDSPTTGTFSAPETDAPAQPFRAPVTDEETAESVQGRIHSPGSQDVPSDPELRTLYAAEKAKGLGDPRLIGDAVVGLGKHLGETAKKVSETAFWPSAKLPLVVKPSFIPSVVTGVGIGDFALADLARKAMAKIGSLDLGTAGDQIAPGAPVRPKPTEDDQFAAWKERYLNNLAGLRVQEDFATGKDLPLPVSQETAQGLVEKGVINPALAELSSYLPNPASVAGAGFSLAGRALSPLTALPRQFAGKAAAKVGEGLSAAGRASQKVAGVGDKVLSKLGTGPAAAVIGATPDLGLKAAKATGKTMEKTGEAVQALAKTSGQSSLGRLEQIAMTQGNPEWVKQAANRLKFLDKPARAIEQTAGAGVAGGATMTGLVAAGADDPDEIWQAAGTGLAIGSLAHLAASPVMSAGAREAALAHDLVKWYARRTPEEQGAVRGWSREQALHSMDLEWLANGVTKDSNVPFVYLSTEHFQRLFGIHRGVAYDLSSGQPRIAIDAGNAGSRTVAHELFHVMMQAEGVVDTGALRQKLVDVVDKNGQPVSKGLYSREEFARRVDEYIGRYQGTPYEKTLQEKLTGNEAQRAELEREVMDELSAEVFANLSEDSRPGRLLQEASSPVRQAMDFMLTQEQGTVLGRLGQVLEQKLGRPITSESDVFSGVKNTPELNALLRDFIRARRKITDRLGYDADGAAASTMSIRAEDVLVKGKEKLIDVFGDNDHFAKDARSTRPDKVWMPDGKTPIVLSPKAVKIVQANRADAMMGKLASVPDSGDPMAVRRKENGAWEGRYFTDEQLAALFSLPEDILTPSVRERMRQINDYARKGDGSAFVIHYNAAQKGKKVSNISEAIRVGVPLSMHISKAANFYVNTFDVTNFHSKLLRWLKDKPKAFVDFDGKDHFVQTVFKYLQNHAAGQHGEVGLDADPARALRMKQRIQDFFNFRDEATEGVNVNRLSKKNDKDVLLRARRIDRINRIEPAATDKMPIDYGLIKENYSPPEIGENPAIGDDVRFSPRAKKERLAPKLTPKMWILPDGKIEATGGQWHVAWLHANAKRVKDEFGFDVSQFTKAEDESGPRLHALNKGFTRVTYEPNTGTMNVEVSTKGWGRQVKDKIFVLAAENVGKIDNMSVTIMNPKGKVVESDFRRLFTYSDREKLNHLPLISDETAGGMSSDTRYSPPTKPAGEKLAPVIPEEAARKLAGDILTAHNEFGGSTFNPLTGENRAGQPFYSVSIYPERGAILDHPPTSEEMSAYILKNQDILADSDNSIGTWFDKEGSGKHYLDVSVVVPDRAFAEYLGKRFNQVGVFDLNKFETINTGGDGAAVEGLGSDISRLGKARLEYQKAAEPAQDAKFSPPSPRSSLKYFGEVSPVPQDQQVLTPDISKQLSRENKARGILDLAKPEHRQELAQALADETEFGLKQSNSGAEWYAENLAQAMETVKTLLPEIANDPAREQLFKAMVAISSNGAKVQDNANTGLALFESFTRDGRIPTEAKISGKVDAIKKGLKRLQSLIDAQGIERTIEFMNTPLTAREINQAMSGALREKFNVKGELMDAQLYGSMAFGPKIGAFYQNLRGNFSPITMDLWFMRTVGRISGNLTELGSPKAMPQQLDRLLVASRGKQKYLGMPLGPVRKEALLIRRELRKGLTAETLQDDPRFAEFRKFVGEVHRQFELGGYKDRSEMNRAAKGLDENLNNVSEAPDNGRHRQRMREAAKLAQDMLKERGIDISNAAFQAALWYYEKRLYKQRGYRTAKEDDIGYAEAFRNIADQRKSGAGRVEPSGSGADPRPGGPDSPKPVPPDGREVRPAEDLSRQ